ncbi:MAG: hypothetical protein AB7I37_13185 [Pirellulales bacterium]
MSRRSSRRSVRATRRPRRQGVILLVVLSVLALFTLLVLTFVVYTSQHRKTAAAAAKADRYDDTFSDLLNHAMLQIVRGSDNPYSFVGTHGLLEDMYGNDWLTGTLVAGGSGVPTTFALGYQYGYDGSSGVPSMMYFDVPLTGADGAPGRLNIDDDSNGMIDDASELGYYGSDDYRQTNGYYNGRVLTMLGGPAGGQTTRITGYAVDTAGGYARIVMLPFETMSTNGATWNAAGAPQVGNNFIINGRPFSGTGFGYDSSTGLTNRQDGIGREYALLPFAPIPLPDSVSSYANEWVDHQAYILGPDGVAGTPDDPINANEDYDGPDYNNMMLAGRVWTGTHYEVALPSLVRPDLIRYWFARQTAAGVDMTTPANQFAILKRTCPRPLPLTPGHPLFTGSNPSFATSSLWTDADSAGTATGIIDAMRNRNWDVDNDGDGRPDSVWIDFGFPVQTAPDGRRYKPLIAPLVLDMDGRLNVNAHGTGYHYAVDGSGNEIYVGLNEFPGNFAGGQGFTTPIPMATGSGVSAAEVSLGAPAPNQSIVARPYLANDGTTIINEYRRLLLGGYPIDTRTGNLDGTKPWLEGKYGEGFLNFDGSGRFPMPGLTSAATPLGNGPDGTANTADDVFDGDFNYPVWPMPFVSGATAGTFRGDFSTNTFYAGSSGAIGVLGSPIDLDGNGVMGLDLMGNPFYVLQAGVNPLPGYTAVGLGEAFNDPMELDLSTKAARTFYNTATGSAGTIDQPFTPAELEAILRRRDRDARTLADRMIRLAPRTFGSDRGTQSITTESWNVAMPTVTLPEELRRVLVSNGIPVPTNLHINDLYALKLLNENGTLTAAMLNANLAIMLPVDLAAGLRLDINRPLGNGADDNGNGVVDDPAEALAGEPIWNGSVIGPVFMNHSNDNIPANRYLARQQLARQLYCLMMLLKDSGYIEPVSAAEGLSDAQRVELTARRIAQWCINVVDFRDRDSIMTPFEYDVFPFVDANSDGITWDVDGWVGYNAVTGAASVDDNDLTNYPHRRLVWGCEQPDLLLTESFAFHDTRTENLATPMGLYSDGTMGDTNFDQRKLPRGAGFVEVQCVRNPNNTAYMGDLYRANGYLDLGKMSPAGTTGQYPVWRLAVTYGGKEDDTNLAVTGGDRNDISKRAYTRPDTTTFQPDDMNPLSASHIPGAAYPVPAGGIITAASPLAATETQNAEIERIVWFCSVPPTNGTTIDADRIYYNYGPGPGVGATNVLLGPGQFAVVGPYRNPDSGPDNITNIGPSAAGNVAAEIWLGNTPAAALPDGTPNTGCRVPVKVTDNGGGDNYPAIGDIQTPLGIAVAGDPNGTANETNNGWDTPIGFSISEPLFSDASYYPKPDDSGNTTSIEHYEGSTSTETDQFVTPLDEPFDHDSARPLGAKPDAEAVYHTHGTRLGYKTVFLQRLADPTIAWNPMPGQTGHNSSLPVNPYLTVDWMPIDLTVFNSEPATPAGVTDPDGNGSLPYYFGTRQRGVPRTPPGSGGTYNIWAQPPVNGPGTSWDAANTRLTTPVTPVSSNPDTTLGYINLPFTLPAAAPGYAAPGYLTATNLATKAPGYPTTYLGDPGYVSGPTYVGGPMPPEITVNGVTYPVGTTYPNLSWNNRPYTSGLEVMQVPASSCSRLLHEFSFGGLREYAGPAPGAPGDGAAFAEGTANGRPFGHLLNLFTSSNDLPAPTYQPENPALARSNYHRVLDYLTVPSRYSGTKDALNPAAVWDTASASLPFHVPFNTVSRYREPGMVNLNTLMDDGTIFRGVMNDYPSAGTTWLAMLQSRRGYGGVVAAPLQALMYDASNYSPTIFANPFRSFGSGYNVPVPALRYRNVDPSGTTFLPRDLVEAGLLRPIPLDTDQNNFTPPNSPLFSNNTGFTALYTPDATMSVPFRNATRNPRFRYEQFQKLGNVATTQSNVYGIWITVGYFEVAPVRVTAANPEGVQLLGELGSDTGEIKRHRAFYLYDRSIPVAFQRGMDHNVDKALLVRRIIE